MQKNLSKGRIHEGPKDNIKVEESIGRVLEVLLLNNYYNQNARWDELENYNVV